MNILEFNLDDYIHDIVDSFAQVYGYEYKEIIKKRIANIQYVIYKNTNGYASYHDFLSKTKKRKLALKFLKKIGIDVSKYEGRSYSEKLDADTEEILKQYIYDVDYGIDPNWRKIPLGIKAFSTNIEEIDKNERTDETQVNFINYIRGDNCDQITLETLPKFKTTKEYDKILKEINKNLSIFEELLDEFEEYAKTIKPYKEFAFNEDVRREEIFNNKRNELYDLIIDQVPLDIKMALDTKGSNIEDKCKILFNGSISSKTYIEYFSEKDEKIIKDSSIDENEKYWIYYFRLQYFRAVGIDVDPWYVKKQYNEFEKREDVKNLIPPVSLVKQITKYREKKHEEARKELIYSSKTFIENINKFVSTSSTKRTIYSVIKDEKICITRGGVTQHDFKPIFFNTIRNGDGGKLDYIFLHELVHCIEIAKTKGIEYKTGFDLVLEDESLNPYNPEKRKYERLNETIADIFAIEARTILHEKDIYFIEPKEIIVSDVQECNTPKILKDLVMPFLTKYRSQIIDARIFVHSDELYDRIGLDNFEELNDAINKVDYLLDQGLRNKLETKKIKDPLVIEYYNQVERIENIYENMEMQHLLQKIKKYNYR